MLSNQSGLALIHALSQETITADNIDFIVRELGNIVSEANDTVDQSPDNLNIISNILSSTSSIVMSGNLTADNSVSLVFKYFVM